MKRTRWIAVGAMTLLCAVSGQAFAKGGGAGGASVGHISSEGSANTNGLNSADRDKGRARAADRAHHHGRVSTHHHSGKSK